MTDRTRITRLAAAISGIALVFAALAAVVLYRTAVSGPHTPAPDASGSGDTESFGQPFVTVKRFFDFLPSRSDRQLPVGVAPPIPSPLPAPFSFPLPTPLSFPNQVAVFNLLWPPSYRQYLTDLQDVLIRKKVLDAGDKVTLANEENVYTFLTRSVDAFTKLGVIRSNGNPRMKQGIQAALRTIKGQELAAYLQFGPPFPAPQEMDLPKISTTLGEAIASAIKSAAMPLFAGSADAQAECFRVGIPNPLPGVNLWAPTCIGSIPVFLGTPIPIGCLNAICPFGNALWDPLTGICGCG